MKRIKMLTLSAGPDGVMDPGKEYDVDDNTAKVLVQGRFAKYTSILRQAIQPPPARKATKPKDDKKATKPQPPEKAAGKK